MPALVQVLKGFFIGLLLAFSLVGPSPALSCANEGAARHARNGPYRTAHFIPASASSENIRPNARPTTGAVRKKRTLKPHTTKGRETGANSMKCDRTRPLTKSKLMDDTRSHGY